MAEKDKELIENIEKQEYKYGFTSDIETETIPRGLNEEVVRLISTKKGEPEWMTERRLKAYRHWLNMVPPTWAHLTIPPIDFQDVIYYAAPKPSKKLASMDEVDPELKRTFDKLGIPLEEQMALAGVAVDAVMDSVSVKTTFKETLAEKGIIFCSMSEAIRDYPELIQKYLGSVVPYTDNFYAALNAAVFSDGSFCYIPKGVRCPMELSTYFRINAAGTGQFERTLIVAIHRLIERYPQCCYFPAFEIMTDDLRDYRFYEKDMAHPSEVAVDYIWEQFCCAALDPSCTGVFRKIDALNRALAHRPLNPENPAYRAFRHQKAAEVRALQQAYPDLDFSRELNFFES